MPQSAVSRGWGILLHSGADVEVVAQAVQRYVGAIGVGSQQTVGAVDGRAGRRRFAAARLLPLLVQ
jgi:hypothetical protein